MTSTKLLALVKWIGGPDDKKYTVGIPVEWFKGFNLAEFQSEKFDASLSYVIEWREIRKEPAGGWTVFDAYVIDVSSRIRVLENKLSALDGLLSATKIVKPVSTLQAQEQDKINAATAANFSDRDISNSKTTPAPNNTTIPTNSDNSDDEFPERNQRNIDSPPTPQPPYTTLPDAPPHVAIALTGFSPQYGLEISHPFYWSPIYEPLYGPSSPTRPDEELEALYRQLAADLEAISRADLYERAEVFTDLPPAATTAPPAYMPTDRARSWIISDVQLRPPHLPSEESFQSDRWAPIP